MHAPFPLPTMDTPMSVGVRHRVAFTRGALDAPSPALRWAFGPAAGTRAIAFVDDGVLAAQPGIVDRLRAAFASTRDLPALRLVEPVAGGERAKRSMEVPERVVRAVDEHGIDRQSFVLAIGGGAVLDAVGFGAAIAHRGVRLVRVPTTVLAQDDAGMAVKNGVNLGRKKNFTGSFAVPHAVVCDLSMLATCPDRWWRCGFSEAVKIALLRDPSLLARIERDAGRIVGRDLSAAAPVIARSAELHYRHIACGGDPFEAASARPLDYGHWLAHRLEGLTDGELPHGEAVSIGVAVDTAYAACAGMLARGDAERVLRALRALRLPVTHPLLADVDSAAAGLEEFREHLGGRLTVTLLRGIGDPVDAHEIDRGTLARAIGAVSGDWAAAAAP